MVLALIFVSTFDNPRLWKMGNMAWFIVTLLDAVFFTASNIFFDVAYFALEQGCLVILFTNFLALVIKAGVASKDSTGSAAYSVALIIVNVLFFLSIWGNAWATAKATFSRRHAQVCARTEPRAAHPVMSRALALLKLDATAPLHPKDPFPQTPVSLFSPPPPCNTGHNAGRGPCR